MRSSCEKLLDAAVRDGSLPALGGAARRTRSSSTTAPGCPTTHAAGRRSAPTPLWLARLLVLARLVVLVTGTVVTGAGPHSGDAGSDAKLKATRLDLAVPDVARIHGTSVMAFLGLVLVTLCGGLARRAPARAGWSSGSGSCSSLIVAQAALGYTQYFNGVPPLLVGFHVAGATAVFSATLAVLLAMYEPVERAGEPVRIRQIAPIGRRSPSSGAEAPPGGAAGPLLPNQ